MHTTYLDRLNVFIFLNSREQVRPHHTSYPTKVTSTYMIVKSINAKAMTPRPWLWHVHTWQKLELHDLPRPRHKLNSLWDELSGGTRIFSRRYLPVKNWSFGGSWCVLLLFGILLSLLYYSKCARMKHWPIVNKGLEMTPAEKQLWMIDLHTRGKSCQLRGITLQTLVFPCVLQTQSGSTIMQRAGSNSFKFW
jgi:hypothetical protein